MADLRSAAENPSVTLVYNPVGNCTSQLHRAHCPIVAPCFTQSAPFSCFAQVYGCPCRQAGIAVVTSLGLDPLRRPSIRNCGYIRVLASQKGRACLWPTREQRRRSGNGTELIIRVFGWWNPGFTNMLCFCSGIFSGGLQAETAGSLLESQESVIYPGPD